SFWNRLVRVRVDALDDDIVLRDVYARLRLALGGERRPHLCEAVVVERVDAEAPLQLAAPGVVACPCLASAAAQSKRDSRRGPAQLRGRLGDVERVAGRRQQYGRADRAQVLDLPFSGCRRAGGHDEAAEALAGVVAGEAGDPEPVRERVLDH